MRLQIRNLPKRGFYEAELRELLAKVVESYKQKMETGEEETCKLPRLKTLIKQVKVVRDAEGRTVTSDDGSQVLKLCSGLAFCEFTEPLMSHYAVRYLNNMALLGSRGLIVDFCLEDARKLQVRNKKLEKFHKIAEEKRLAQKKEVRLAKRAKAREDDQQDQTSGIQVQQKQDSGL